MAVLNWNHEFAEAGYWLSDWPAGDYDVWHLWGRFLDTREKDFCGPTA